MFQKKRVLTRLIFFIAFISGIYFYTRFNPDDYHFFPKCPVYLLTGYKCPGCGSQRAFYHLFHGNLTTAFQYNQLIILLSPYILFGLYLAFIANKNNQKTVIICKLFYGKWAVFLLAFIFILFTLLRNF